MSFLEDVVLSLVISMIIVGGALLFKSELLYYAFIVGAGLGALHIFNRVKAHRSHK